MHSFFESSALLLFVGADDQGLFYQRYFVAITVTQVENRATWEADAYG